MSVRWQVFEHICLPLHPEHWMKKLMRSRREESLSVTYASIQSSITACTCSTEERRILSYAIKKPQLVLHLGNVILYSLL